MSQPIRIRKAAPASSYSTSTQPLSQQDTSDGHTKNVVVLGGSYGGMHAATVLAQKLPPSHRVILIERNSHFNHLYVFPRFSVLPGHEHKAFIPYSSIFKDSPTRLDPRQTRSRNTRPKSNNRAPATASGSSAQNALEMGSNSSHPEQKSSRKCTSSPSMSDVPEGVRLDESSASSSLVASDDVSDGSRSPSSLRARSRDSRHSSSTSFSSRADTDSLGTSYDTASSPASSYVASDAKLAGSGGVESELAENASKARREESLGRPEIQVVGLEDAVEQGLDIDGTKDTDSDSDGAHAAEGFESSAPHVVLQATVTDITPSHITVTPSAASASSDAFSHFPRKKSLWSIDSVQIPYSHLVYALGSHLPDPLRTEARSKQHGVEWMREIQDRIKTSNEIVLVGGGALGVEFATDIASVYPGKQVTLIHSRKQLLPNFDERVHEVAYHRLRQLGVHVVLGERLALTEGCPRGSTVTDSSPLKQPEVCVTGDAKGEGVQAHQEGMCIGSGRKLVRTTGGKSFSCDLLLLCTGQQPNSSLMAKLSPSSVDPGSRLVRVHRTLQVSVPDPRDAAQQPFDAKPPCGDCDCFLDKKASGSELKRDEEGHLESHLGYVPGKLSNVYAIGDVADAFGALNAGYQAWNMADVATENILADIAAQSESSGSSAVTNAIPQMQNFEPAVNMLKLSLGLGKMVFQGATLAHDAVANPGDTGALDDLTTDLEPLSVNGRVHGKPEITIKDDPHDLGVEGVWTFMANADTSNMHK